MTEDACPTEAGEDFRSASAAVAMVMDILVPVSPSGTGNTLRSLMACFWAVMAAAPLHEIWLSVWGVAGDDPAPLVRFFASALPAAPTGALVFALLPVVERLVGFDGPEAEGRSA